MNSESQDARVTIDGLRQFVLSNYPTPNPLAEAHLAALHTTGRIMGKDWVEHWYCEFSKNNVPGTYFRPSEDADDQHVVWRQVRFAELLFNFQHLDGFWDRRTEWQGHPESAAAELESVFYMISCGHRPSFTSPDVDGGKSRDFDVILRWGNRGAWEAKARLETTKLDPKTLNNVLNNARRQLPKGICNIILVRIPECWSLEESFEQTMSESADYLFRNSSSRAISLLYHWELWGTHREAPNNFGVAGLEFVNLPWEILNPGRRVMRSYSGFPSGWVSFTELRPA
jgi:hypothetical protein